MDGGGRGFRHGFMFPKEAHPGGGRECVHEAAVSVKNRGSEIESEVGIKCQETGCFVQRTIERPVANKLWPKKMPEIENEWGLIDNQSY